MLPAHADGLPGVRERAHRPPAFRTFSAPERTGAGGMGYVCRAFDNTLQRDVALKLLRKNLIHDPDYLEHLQNEAQAAASISHPNVVKVYSVGVENGFYFICMEIVTGGTLAQYLNQKARLVEAEALRIAIEVAEGLDAAYSAGLLHRDVKPGNILFTDQRIAKVADFGLATRADRTAPETDIWGTPFYLAPEVLLGEPADVRADIYALGATLFHILAGRPVFTGATGVEVAQKHISSQPLSVQTFASETSGATTYVISQMLQKDPAGRPHSYAEVLTQLRFALTESVKSGGAPRQALRKPANELLETEQRAMAWFTIVVLGIILIGGAAAVWHFKQQRETVPVHAVAQATPARVVENRLITQPTPEIHKNNAVSAPTAATTPDSHNPSTSAQNAAAPAKNFPEGFTNIDLGFPGKRGSSSYDSTGAKWTVSGGGGGSDINDPKDGFQFVNKTVSGDMTLQVKVTEMESTDRWARAGVMFRDSTSPESPFAGLYMTADRGVSMQWRNGSGSFNWVATAHMRLPSAKQPVWLKLVRRGSPMPAIIR